MVVTSEHDRIYVTWYGDVTSKHIWTLPGGEVEFEESLVREVHEELGSHESVGRPLVSSGATFSVENSSPQPFKQARIAFNATIISGELGTIEINRTTEEVRQVPSAELQDHEPRGRIVDEAYRHIRRGTDR